MVTARGPKISKFLVSSRRRVMAVSGALKIEAINAEAPATIITDGNTLSYQTGSRDIKCPNEDPMNRNGVKIPPRMLELSVTPLLHAFIAKYCNASQEPDDVSEVPSIFKVVSM